MTFYFRDTVPVSTGTVSVAFTDASLDLSEPDVLAALAETIEARPVVMHQVHGREVSLADAERAEPARADALVTDRPGLALAARAADCVPVVLVADSGPIGAVHAGRDGVRLDVVTAAVEQLRDLGAEAIRAWIGPSVCGGCYEVPDDLRAEVAAVVPATFATTTWGTPSLDLAAGVHAQLVAAQVAVTLVDGCTREDPRLHSYRRDGAAAGRHAGVVWRTP